MKKWLNRAFILGLLATTGWYSKEKYCVEFPTSGICAVPSPTPSSTPVPTATPDPTPDPTPTPTTPPTPVPPSPTVEPLPVRFPLQTATVRMRIARYGNGLDSTVHVFGDPELCEALHHKPVPNGNCHFESNVWKYHRQRALYEGYVLAGARDGLPTPNAPLGPVWQYKAGSQYGRCHDDRRHVNTSCDHFGDAEERDDPNTRYVFEGEPKWLAAQSDDFGPYAGFFTMPQLEVNPTYIRVCPPLEEGNEDTCSPWIHVDWR